MKKKKKKAPDATDVAINSIMDKTIASAASDLDSPSSSASGIGDDAPEDNTMLYVVGGIAVLGVLGLGFYWWKKQQPAQV